MNALFRILFRLLADLVGLIALAFRLQQGTAAENLVLQRQLALTKERDIKLRRIDVRSPRPTDKQALKPSTPIRRVRSEAARFQRDLMKRRQVERGNTVQKTVFRALRSAGIILAGAPRRLTPPILLRKTRRLALRTMAPPPQRCGNSGEAGP